MPRGIYQRKAAPKAKKNKATVVNARSLVAEAAAERVVTTLQQQVTDLRDELAQSAKDYVKTRDLMQAHEAHVKHLERVVWARIKDIATLEAYIQEEHMNATLHYVRMSRFMESLNIKPMMTQPVESQRAVATGSSDPVERNMYIHATGASFE